MRGLRILKILSYLFWLVSSALFIPIVYNFQSMSINYSARSEGGNIFITISIAHRGFVFDLKVNVTISLFDSSKNLVARNGTVITLKPGESKSQEIALSISGDVSYKEVIMYIAQIISGLEIVAIRLRVSLQ